MKRYQKALLIVAMLLVGGSVRYIAGYDPVVDSNARRLQVKLDALFEELSRTAGTPEGAYELYAPRYDGMRADITGLQHDAASQPHNQLTQTSLSLIDDNLRQLEAAHREGLSPTEVPVLRKLFDTQLRMLVELETAKKRESASGGSR